MSAEHKYLKKSEDNFLSARHKQKEQHNVDLCYQKEQHNVDLLYLCTRAKNVKIKGNDKLGALC